MKLFGSRQQEETNTIEAKLITFNPKEVSETIALAKQLLDGNAIIIDFSNTPNNIAVRIVDYISGMLMATKGDYRRLGKKIFLLSLDKEINDHYEEEIKKTLENE